MLKMNKIILLVVALAAVAGCKAPKQGADSCPGRDRSVVCAQRDADLSIEVERAALHAAYQLAEKDFEASHRMMGGGRFSYAMLRRAEDVFDGRWAGIVTNWFYSTARNDAERRLMRAYGVGVGDLKYSREELNQVMKAWLSVSSGQGRFESCQVSFTNGVAFFRNTEYDCLMKLELRKDWIWVHGGNVFLFATSDVAANGGYGASDALYESWFLRFKGGTITGSCHFRHGCNAFFSLRYHLDVANDFIMVTSTKTGDIVGELRLGLRGYVDSNGKKRYGKVEYSGSQAEF